LKAVEYDRYGPASVLAVRDVPRPSPGRGEILVRVRAAALNPKDVIVHAGQGGRLGRLIRQAASAPGSR